jgi:hypothetical protein
MVHTGAGLFFDLDVTHSRSAFAKRGGREAVGLEVSNLKFSNGHDQNKLSSERGEEMGATAASVGRNGGDLPFSE